MAQLDFDEAFKALTDNPPFPWQGALYHDHFAKGAIPASCNLPTGLGKTSVIAVWLIALASGAKVPRRLVYVVNRRTVVDQTTDEVEKYRKNLEAAGIKEPLAISTLRGQFADNREWSADPSRPAVICGTVDMIGSRLLFSGYGCGFKTRPLHAGFLGQDALIVHDEAHLEPAFQELLIAIEKEQREGRTPDFCPLRVMELTATSRAGGEAFVLTDDDKKNSVVLQRINATKKLHLNENKDEKKLAEEIADLALKYKDAVSKPAVLIFVRKVDDVAKIVAILMKAKQKVQQLTGTLRGLERDRMADPRKADACPIFARFLKPPKEDAPESEKWKVKPEEGTVYLVCTSAGEVGVNISADHLVCDLSTFESMAQRFGRVNRFGDRKDTEIHVVYPKEFDSKDGLDARLSNTLELLKQLDGIASPSALGALVRAKRDQAEREGSGADSMSRNRSAALRDYILEAFSPQPVILPTSDILFDTWALTSANRPLVKDDLPGRPPVAEYLHGVEDDKQRETHVAWRAEVRPFARAGLTDKQIGELLDEFPLKPHELLRDATYRIQDHLAELAEGREDEPAWLIEPDDTVRVVKLGDLTAKDKAKRYIENLSARTVVLPPHVGGLTETGTLSGTAKYDADRKYDVAGLSLPASRVPLVRLLVSVNDGERTYKPLAPVSNLPADFTFTLDGESERERLRDAFSEQFPAMRAAYLLDLQDTEDEAEGPIAYLVLKAEAPKKKSPYPPAWPSLEGDKGHLRGVQNSADAICSRLNLPDDVVKAASLAAGWHDLGKDRGVWQRGAGNARGAKPVAKTLHGRPPENLNGFRHELASLVDVNYDPAYTAMFRDQTEPCRELLLHLIAAHHGRGRPHFPEKEATDPERPDIAAQAIVAETPQRFARLQRKYGRWGLAYLESLLRAADALDSKRIEETPIGSLEPGTWPRPKPEGVVWSAPTKPPVASISVNVDPTNPGQFFACCGLLELADRLWPDAGAEGWFANGQFHVKCAGTLRDLLSILVMDPPTAIERLTCNGLEVAPIIAPLAFTFDGGSTAAITLDAWTRIAAVKGVPQVISNPPWNFWAGNQKSAGIWLGLRTELAAQLMQFGSDELEKLFSQRLFQKGRFGFDPGPAWNALDVGFSPNEQGMEVESSPAVEMLAAVGLQRFRPVMNDSRDAFDYFTWHSPYPPVVAAAAMVGALPDTCAVRYRGSVVSRGQYAALGFSYPIRQGASNE